MTNFDQNGYLQPAERRGFLELNFENYGRKNNQ
jgi:hypothetical protein